MNGIRCRPAAEGTGSTINDLGYFGVSRSKGTGVTWASGTNQTISNVPLDLLMAFDLCDAGIGPPCYAVKPTCSAGSGLQAAAPGCTSGTW